MKKNVINNRTVAKVITVLIPISFIGLLALRDFVIRIIFRLPACIYYRRFHLYCPSCGNTRSVAAFLKGDFLSALRYNITPIFILLLFLCAYIEIATYGFGRHLRILPRKGSFYIIGAIILVIYAVLRNFIPYLTP